MEKWQRTSSSSSPLSVVSLLAGFLGGKSQSKCTPHCTYLLCITVLFGKRSRYLGMKTRLIWVRLSGLDPVWMAHRLRRLLHEAEQEEENPARSKTRIVSDFSVKLPHYRKKHITINDWKAILNVFWLWNICIKILVWLAESFKVELTWNNKL